MSENKVLSEWVAGVEKKVRPAKVSWCDGSEEEKSRLIAELSRTYPASPLLAKAKKERSKVRIPRTEK